MQGPNDIYSFPPGVQVQKDVADLEGMLADKEALLRKALERVQQWEFRFDKLREGQKPLLFES